MASIDFDSVLDVVGAEGRYQTVLYYLLCIPATVPAAFLAFNQVFLSATPAHRCHVPELANLTLDQRKAISIPINGAKYSDCTMLNINYTEILKNNVLTGQWSSETDQLLPPSLPVPDPKWPVTNCLNGWEYDTTQYDATLVT